MRADEGGRQKGRGVRTAALSVVKDCFQTATGAA